MLCYFVKRISCFSDYPNILCSDHKLVRLGSTMRAPLYCKNMVLIDKYHLLALKEESAMVIYELDIIIILQRTKGFTLIQMIHFIILL